MTYSPNVPAVTVSEDLQVSDIRKVLLAEFAGGAPVRELLMDLASAEPPEPPVEAGKAPTPEQMLAMESFPTKPVSSASGLRLHRVLSPAHEVVTQFDANRDLTPLDFLAEAGAVVAVSQPGPVYSWKLVQLGRPSEDGNIAPILAMRAADETEAAALDEMYPGWLENCRRFDEQTAAAEATSPTLPPPALLATAPAA